MAPRNEQTSKRVGKISARILKSRAPKRFKSAAGSALTQRPSSKRRKTAKRRKASA